MTGRNLGPWLKICWSVLTPALTLAMLISSVVNYVPLKYKDYVYPSSGEAVGYLLGFSSVLLVPLYFFYAFLKAPGIKICEKWRSAVQPDMKETLRIRAQQDNEPMPLPSIEMA